MRRAVFATILAACSLASPRQGHTQRMEDRIPAVRATPVAAAADSMPAPKANFHLGPIKIPRRDSSWWVPIASAIVPGAGQALLGQDRFIAYAALEAFSLVNYADHAADERRQRDGLRSLAANVARALFPGPHPVGNWPYYELMENPQWIESGVYNRFPGGTFSPEVDLTTYNGALWLDVRQRYWTNPNVQPDPSSQAYQLAIQEYQARAITDAFRWSWRNAQLEQDVYRQMVNRKNQANRDATMQLEVLAANHVLSAVDAFITVRLRGGMSSDGKLGFFSVTVPWAPFGRPAYR